MRKPEWHELGDVIRAMTSIDAADVTELHMVDGQLTVNVVLHTSVWSVPVSMTMPFPTVRTVRGGGGGSGDSDTYATGSNGRGYGSGGGGGTGYSSAAGGCIGVGGTGYYDTMASGGGGAWSVEHVCVRDEGDSH